MNKKEQIFCVDTSAILSGKPIDFSKGNFMTTSDIAEEFSPGGRDYNRFQLFCEQGLVIFDPNDQSVDYIKIFIKKYGEFKRLSKADISILALAYQLNKSDKKYPIIITDDYSMQNMANYLSISFQTMSQKGITKRFKWERRCQGCKKIIHDDVDVCPICGSSISHRVQKSLPVKKWK